MGTDKRLLSQNDHMSISTTILPDTTYYDIESDASDYIESDDYMNDGNLTNEDILEMST